MTSHSFWFYGFFFFGIILVRYVLIAGGTHWFFASVLGKSFVRRGRPQQLLWKAIQKDVRLSVLSTIIFALCAAFSISQYNSGATLLYTDLHQYGLWYLGFSFIAILILQDTYFYFTHRLVHHPWLFKWFHYGHHHLEELTPWRSFAFDPPEAVIQALFLVGIVFVIPLHFITLISLSMTMTVWAVVNHLGFNLFPATLLVRWFGKWFIGPLHHSTHHRKYTVHYGLYFTFWDSLLGTQDAHYQEVNTLQESVRSRSGTVSTMR